MLGEVNFMRIRHKINATLYFFLFSSVFLIFSWFLHIGAKVLFQYLDGIVIVAKTFVAYLSKVQTLVEVFCRHAFHLLLTSLFLTF